ncbi:VOC family protein [Streptacidiphilus sp. N1-12]|uniref:VOC family protein n=2 Tax=Streptacidiphilus alkalitolerans TaxID=3342712 RepID=A0ABV6W8G8_9ACTN
MAAESESMPYALGVPCVPGAPSWVSLLSRDPDASRRFYGELLGWEFQSVDEREGSYSYATVQGVSIAGVGAVPSGWRGAPTWTVFFGVADIDAAVRRTRERLGTVGIGPLDLSSGRVAVAVDPDNAVFGLWQGEPGPARTLRMSGAPSWMELSTDAFAAALFYGAVLDWAVQDRSALDVSWENERVVLRAAGRRIAALRTAEPTASALPERPVWRVFFSVGSADAAAGHASRLGGTLIAPIESTPYGRVARLRDPEGTQFSLISADG